MIAKKKSATPVPEYFVVLESNLEVLDLLGFDWESIQPFIVYTCEEEEVFYEHAGADADGVAYFFNASYLPDVSWIRVYP